MRDPRILMTYNCFTKDLAPDRLRRFHKTIFTKYALGTNAIEGNSLTDHEVESVITDGTSLERNRIMM